MLITAGDNVAHSFDVFIEDTDCFGVVYNANYLKVVHI
jgi:acyl-CoA thioesterase FadM